MAETVIDKNEFSEKSPREIGFKRFIRVFFGRGLVIFGAIVIIILIIAAVFAPWVAPYDPYDTNLKDKFIKLGIEHPLGTDYLGRDVLSRIIYGSRTSLIVGLVAVGFTLMSIPPIMLALAIASLLGGGLKNVVIALAVSFIPPYARMMCGQALHIKENDYVMASRSIGARDLRIMFIHIAPNCFPPLIVMMTMQMGRAILAEAGLSFLGIGIEPPGAAWGAMVNEGYQYLFTEPLLSFFPGIAIMLVVFSFNMVGDGLRDALDPRLRGTL
ncbi:MAG: ABC transporter permease [Deltaproteobacteria bacterium]|nr:ABC transporter permease [Deltaproteobacteria bacterium]